jgi:hypothetical protein
VRLRTRRPRGQRQLAQAGQLGRVGDLGGLAADQDAPAGAGRLLGPVDPECDPAAPGRGVELGSFVGAEHHHVPLEDEVDRKHGGSLVVHHRHPAEALTGKQRDAFGLG